MKNILTITLIVSLAISVFMCERYRGQDERVIITTDTLRVVITDTITLTKVEYRDRYIVRTDTLLHIVTDTLNSVDTLSVDTIKVPVPIYHYTFTDDTTYTAEVSGYNVSLDKMSIYNNTVYERIETERIIKPRIKRWGVGIQVGYGLPLSGSSAARPQPYIGVGVSYNFIRF